MDIDTSLQVLDLLCDALTTPRTEQEALDRICRIVDVLMETRQTAILLRDEDRGELIVKNRTGIAAPGVRPGNPLKVPPRIKNILWRVRYVHRIGALKTGIEGIAFPIVVAPLRVRAEPVGVLIAGGLKQPGNGFSPVQRRLFGLVAAFASLVLENAKVSDYLHQQFAQRSRELMEANRREAGGGGDAVPHLVVTSLTAPSRVARLLAVSFYKELARAGFSPNHIMNAAAEILACINREPPVEPGAGTARGR